MKNFIYISVFSIVLASGISCSTDRFPETSLMDERFWNNENDVRLAANFFYTKLPTLGSSQGGDLRTFVWTDARTDSMSDDMAASNTPNTISDGSRVTPATSMDYNYFLIYQANNLLENAPRAIANGGNETLIRSYTAEARFFRAWSYYELLIRYGGVPLITKTNGIDDPDLFKPRATRDEIVDFIYQDLDFAIDNLRTADQLQTAGEYGRISRTAAQAFKARVALFEGTRCKFHNYGDFHKHLTIAKESAYAVMTSGAHALYSTPSTGPNGEPLNRAYFNLFQEAGEGRANKENIIVKIYGNSFENNILSVSVQRTYEGGGPTEALASSYLMIDGLPISKSPLYVAPNAASRHVDAFDGRDPRMSFSILKRGDEFTSSNYTIPNASFQITGYGIRKYTNPVFWARQGSFIDRPVLRYAEVLLTYAEATYELDNTISDADLESTINQLRARLPQVNISKTGTPDYRALPKLTNAFVTANGLNMREEIRRERRVELAFEGFRYWDLLRWKTAETELPKPMLGSYLYTEFYTTGNWQKTTPVDGNNHIIFQSGALRKFNPNRDYLWPFPTTEIAKNPALTQNPGW